MNMTIELTQWQAEQIRAWMGQVNTGAQAPKAVVDLHEKLTRIADGVEPEPAVKGCDCRKTQPLEKVPAEYADYCLSMRLAFVNGRLCQWMESIYQGEPGVWVVVPSLNL